MRYFVVRLGRAQLAGDLEARCLGLAALELDAVFGFIGFDAVETGEEVQVPEGAAEFAVGDALKTDGLFFGDQFPDGAIFDHGQFGGGDFARLALGTGILKILGTQETADVVGSEGWLN